MLCNVFSAVITCVQHVLGFLFDHRPHWFGAKKIYGLIESWMDRFSIFWHIYNTWTKAFAAVKTFCLSIITLSLLLQSTSSMWLQEWKSLWRKDQMMLFWCSLSSPLPIPQRSQSRISKKRGKKRWTWKWWIRHQRSAPIEQNTAPLPEPSRIPTTLLPYKKRCLWHIHCITFGFLELRLHNLVWKIVCSRSLYPATTMAPSLVL